MLRLVLEQVALFSLPFVLFAGWLLLARRSPLDGAEWRPQWTRLVLAGLFVVVASLLMAGLTGSATPRATCRRATRTGAWCRATSSDGAAARPRPRRPGPASRPRRRTSLPRRPGHAR
ncbi:DUF6111 family protein [Methylorubrum suomiense]